MVSSGKENRNWDCTWVYVAQDGFSKIGIQVLGFGVSGVGCSLSWMEVIRLGFELFLRNALPLHCWDYRQQERDTGVR